MNSAGSRPKGRDIPPWERKAPGAVAGLGAKQVRRSESDSDTGYRNGYGRPQRLTLSSGTIQLRMPRVRNTEEQFESRPLPLFVNRTRKVAELNSPAVLAWPFRR